MKTEYTKQWIIDNAINIVDRYEKGILTLRALHYQLVGLGMINDISHYKKVVNAMIDARWDNVISFDTFSDLDRTMVGETEYKETVLDDEIDIGKQQISAWMNNYSKNRWENQPVYPEIFIEKKALQGVFQKVCDNNSIALGACKGYPSLTFLYEASLRFKEAYRLGKRCVIIYFGDYDPSGEDIPRSIKENFRKFGIDVDFNLIALNKEQVLEWKLPPAPAKLTDTRTANWDGLGQVELDALKPETLIELCEDAINDVFSEDIYDELLYQERNEKVIYKEKLVEYVQSL